TAKEQPLIHNGRIDKVIVHQQSRLWEFHLSFDELMAVMLYQTFMQQLELAFHQIAQVSVQITTNQTTLTEEQLTDYWQLALLNSQCNTPLVQK
ncbi:PolC-type DNA polymerase III N-terminal domain-containing protein, partial [Enterococcus faecalis]|uniref:PolC-type DNA polymerase III N-terminal domain-containing protein n=1 Tax=Enterococcus faecalis TaxID=1351 RepID=UPI003CC69324